MVDNISDLENIKIYLNGEEPKNKDLLPLFEDDQENLVNNNNKSKFGLKKSLTNFFSTLKNVKVSFNNKISNSNKNCFIIEKNLKIFFLLFLSGLFLLFMSFMFLPMVLFKPQKFVSCFNLGTFLTIFSFVFYYGSKDFFEMLFNKERKNFTFAYLFSLCVDLYLMNKSTLFIFALFLNVVQMLIMVSFLLSFVPGGKSGVKLIISNVLNSIKNLGKK